MEEGREGGKEATLVKAPLLKGQPVVEEDWGKVGKSLKEVVVMSEREREEADEAALDAMVV
jgi:hypothetical protein